MQWNKTFGGTSGDYGYFVQQTTDGGYIIIGTTGSYGAGSMDVWLIKTDASNNMQWNKTFGGTDSDYGYSVQQTMDNGYIITGYTFSYGAGYSDVWLIKTDTSGVMQWDKTFGGTFDDRSYSMQQTTDGGYIITGYTRSFEEGYGDVWLIKTDENGYDVEENDETSGGTSDDIGYSVRQTSDDGFIITGSTASGGVGGSDIWLVKKDRYLYTLWSQTYGNTGNDIGFSVKETSDYGYVLTGEIDYGVKKGEIIQCVGLKTDFNGNQEWLVDYGGSSNDGGRDIQQTFDGMYVISGYTYSSGSGGSDMYLLKLNAAGNEIWSYPFGGSSDDFGYGIAETSDHGYIITGYTESYGTAARNVWLVKTDSSGNLLWNNTYYQFYKMISGAEVLKTYNICEGRSVVETSDGSIVVTGVASPNDNGYSDLVVLKTDANGSLLWNKAIGSDWSDNAGYSVVEMAEGGFAINGYYVTQGSSKAETKDFFMIKTDTNGYTTWSGDFGGVDDEEGYAVTTTNDGGFVLTGYTVSYGTAGSKDLWLVFVDTGYGSGGVPFSSITIFILVSLALILSLTGLFIRKKYYKR